MSAHTPRSIPVFQPAPQLIAWHQCWCFHHAVGKVSLHLTDVHTSTKIGKQADVLYQNELHVRACLRISQRGSNLGISGASKIADRTPLRGALQLARQPDATLAVSPPDAKV